MTFVSFSEKLTCGSVPERQECNWRPRELPPAIELCGSTDNTSHTYRQTHTDKLNEVVLIQLFAHN